MRNQNMSNQKLKLQSIKLQIPLTKLIKRINLIKTHNYITKRGFVMPYMHRYVWRKTLDNSL